MLLTTNDISKKKNLKQLYHFLRINMKLAGVNWVHRTVSEAIIGKDMMLSLDCKTCHKVEGNCWACIHGCGKGIMQAKADVSTLLVIRFIKGGGGRLVKLAYGLLIPNLKEG